MNPLGLMYISMGHHGIAMVCPGNATETSWHCHESWQISYACHHITIVYHGIVIECRGNAVIGRGIFMAMAWPAMLECHHGLSWKCHGNQSGTVPTHGDTIDMSWRGHNSGSGCQRDDISMTLPRKYHRSHCMAHAMDCSVFGSTQHHTKQNRTVLFINIVSAFRRRNACTFT